MFSWIRVVCLVLVSLGSMMLAYALLCGRHLPLAGASTEANRRPDRLGPLLCGVLLFFLSVGTLVVVHLLRDPLQIDDLAVSLIFFVFPLLALCCVEAYRRMAMALADRTLETLQAFLNAMMAKDAYTLHHSLHVHVLTGLLWDRLPLSQRREADRDSLMNAALLHDIGKLAIPSEILQKRGPLTDQEWQIIKTHTDCGAELLLGTCFAQVSEWVRCHHERMDGEGYRGLAREEIPLAAQIIAVADTYSALTSDRLYGPARSHGEAVAVLAQAAGTQLSADLVALFLDIPESSLGEAYEQVFAGCAFPLHPASRRGTQALTSGRRPRPARHTACAPHGLPKIP